VIFAHNVIADSSLAPVLTKQNAVINVMVDGAATDASVSF